MHLETREGSWSGGNVVECWTEWSFQRWDSKLSVTKPNSANLINISEIVQHKSIRMNNKIKNEVKTAFKISQFYSLWSIQHCLLLVWHFLCTLICQKFINQWKHQASFLLKFLLTFKICKYQTDSIFVLISEYVNPRFLKIMSTFSNLLVSFDVDHVFFI